MGHTQQWTDSWNSAGIQSIGSRLKHYWECQIHCDTMHASVTRDLYILIYHVVNATFIRQICHEIGVNFTQRVTLTPLVCWLIWFPDPNRDRGGTRSIRTKPVSLKTHDANFQKTFNTSAKTVISIFASTMMAHHIVIMTFQLSGNSQGKLYQILFSLVHSSLKVHCS